MKVTYKANGGLKLRTALSPFSFLEVADKMTQTEETPVSGALGDYLEAIYELSGDKSYVRVTDISVYLNISKPSVNRAVNTLRAQGLVEHKPYGDISLTEKGREVGAEIYKRHRIVKRFLMNILDIPSDMAEREANYIERGVSRYTIDKMAELTDCKMA